MRGFSWKRVLGISAAKARISRKIGIPLSASGRRAKFGPAGLWGFKSLLNSRRSSSAGSTSTPSTTANGCVGCGCLSMFGLGALALVMPRQNTHFVPQPPIAEIRNEPTIKSEAVLQSVVPSSEPVADKKSVTRAPLKPAQMSANEFRLQELFRGVPEDVIKAARVREERAFLQEIRERDQWWADHKAKDSELFLSDPMRDSKLRELGQQARERRKWEEDNPVDGDDPFFRRMKAAIEEEQRSRSGGTTVEAQLDTVTEKTPTEPDQQETKDEQRANGILKLARQYQRIKQPKKARSLLEQLVKEFPETAAGREAAIEVDMAK